MPLDIISVFLGHTTTRMVETTYGRVPSDVLARKVRHHQGDPDCSTYVVNEDGSEGFQGSQENSLGQKTPSFSVSRDRIELSTRGFSIPKPRGVSDWEHWGKRARLRVV